MSSEGDMSKTTDQAQEPVIPKPAKPPKKSFRDFVKGRHHGGVGPEQAKAIAAGLEPTPPPKPEAKARVKPKKNSFRAFVKGELQD